MAQMTNQQKKEWAKLLYTKEHLPQIEIAERVGVSPVTVNRWIKRESWELLQASLTVTREEQLGHLYRQVAELNNNISNREEGERFANAKEADALNKLAAAISRMEKETGIGEIISSFQQFLTFLRATDLELAKRFVPLMDAFIKSKL